MRMLAALIVAFAMLAGAARAEDLPDQRPMLRIEPGMHTTVIKRMGADAACRFAVTGSDDKTARVWALPEGGRGSAQPLHVLRMPIGEGNDGKVYAVAMSPDGRWVAAGGYNQYRDHWVYIFETATGRLVTRLGRLPNVINQVAFSPDGSRLAATLMSGEGMRIWEVAGWRLAAEDRDYGGKDSYGAVFDNANRLYTVAYDGQIRRYGVDGALDVAAVTQGGKEPYAISVDPRAAKVAVSFNDTTSIELYNAQTLQRLYAADTGGITTGNFYAVGWSRSGALLYAGGRSYKLGGRNPVVIWQDAGQGTRSAVPLSQSTIVQILPCGGGLAVASQDPAFGLITEEGTKRSWQEGVTADMRGKKRDAFTLSANGKRVRFGSGENAKNPFLFDLAAFRLSQTADAIDDLAQPKTTGLAVTDWENQLAPKLNGKPIPIEPHEMSRSLAISPDASLFVLGTEFWLRAFHADGSKLWQKSTPGIAYGVNISRDGRLLAAAYYDGTIRWHRVSDGRELLALFVHAKDRRFAVWTPKGYYAASPGAEDLIGWHVNRDWEHIPDFFPVSRFRDQFNRPDIVKRVLDDLDEDKAIAEANQLRGSGPAEEIAKRLPPVITILSPPEGATFEPGNLTIRYVLRSPSGADISEVSALVDGRPLPGATVNTVVRGSESGTEKTFTLTGLAQRDLTLSLVARAADTESSPASVHLKFQGGSPASAPALSLYALVVGVSKFKDPTINSLGWASKDARDFAQALKQQQGALYRKVEVKLLADEDADNGSIIDGLTWLKRQVGQGDTGVVFLAGHGVTDPSGEYYYVPYNAKVENVAGVPLPTRSSSVPDNEIRFTLKKLAGNALFFFDTCHSGKAAGISFRGAQDYNKLINEIADSANAIVLASSTGDELSQERDDWQHGAFTKALLEGLGGAADVLPKDGIVTVDELNLYVKERVKELTGGLQHPVDLKPKEARNIAFAKVP